MPDNKHATFLEHDCIPSQTKVELLTVRKNFSNLSRPSKWYKVKHKTFIKCFEHDECIAIDIFDVLGNE